jgi:hypothetical protein
MKNVLKLSLAVLAAATLAACGGGGSSDVADAYVGNWKSNCHSYIATDGNKYYKTFVSTYTKASVTEIAVTHADTNAYSDSSCKNLLTAINSPAAWKLNLGAKTTYLGASVDAMVWSFPATGEARPGYITTDGAKMSLVVVNTDGSQPTGWSTFAPFTKQ